MSIVKYSYLNAKIKAKTSKMLTKKDYLELLSKKSVTEVANYLKYHTSYGKVLEGVDENSIHRGDLEETLKKWQFRRSQKLMKLIKGKEANFMRFILLRYEIEDIKMMVRELHIHKSLSSIEQYLYFFEKSHINIEKLLSATSIEEFINYLKGTEYYDILHRLVESDQTVNMFTVETALDLYYYKWIHRAKEKYLSGEDKRIITKAIGEEVDILNMLWIYRVKKFYHMDEDLIFRYLIPGGYRITKEQHQKMVRAEDAESLLKIYRDTVYAEIFEKTTSLFYDYNYWQYILEMHKNLLKTKPFSIASVISYLHLKEVELKFVTTIIEGIRYGLQPEEFKKVFFPFKKLVEREAAD